MKISDMFRRADDAFRRGVIEVLAQELMREVQRGGAKPGHLAMRVLRSLGGEFWPVRRQAPRELVDLLGQLWDLLASYSQPERQPLGKAAEIEEQLRRQRGAKLPEIGQVQVPLTQGFQQLPPDHPLVTGDMVPVDSSNVHSVGYDLEHHLLYVRYLDPAGRAGPLYGYHDVRPEEFLDLLDAPSKGTWVWDNLRERGTVAGYRKPYFLAGVTRGYVPRHAVLARVGGQLAEVFRPRTSFVGGRWLESRKPLRVVRVLQPVKPPRTGIAQAG